MSTSEASSSCATPRATSSPEELRQKLLQRIFEYNTDKNTPPDLRIHVTGLTLEEGAVFERDPSPDIEDPGSQAPHHAPVLPSAILDPNDRSPKTPETQPEHETPKSKEELTYMLGAKIKLRDLQREKETLEMEGRRRAAKEQIDTRWQERALKDWRENKAKVNYDTVPDAGGNNERIHHNIDHDEDVLQQAAIDNDLGSGGIGPIVNKKKSPPKGINHLAESRRKLNKEWAISGGHRMAVRQNDESTRNNLLRNVNRAIAAAEAAALKGAGQFEVVVDRDGARSDTTDGEAKYTNKDSRFRDEHYLASPGSGHAPPPLVDAETESRRRGGNEYRNGSPVPEERGRRRGRAARDTSSDSQTHKRKQERAVEDPLRSTGRTPPSKGPPLHQGHKHANDVLRKDVPVETLRLAQEAEKSCFVVLPGANIQIPPMSPLVPKVVKPQTKLEPLPVIFPVPAIRDSRLLPNGSPAQWKLRTQREMAKANFEKDKSKYKAEVGAARKNEQAGLKGILKRDRKGKDKAIAWADEPTDSEGENMINPREEMVSYNDRADQEELRKLDDKRAKWEENYKCLATESKIERENMAARQRAEELAEKLLRGGGGSEDRKDTATGK
ncbi:3000802a-aa7e-4831-b9d0-99827151b752-CDS [Sclerotinia trifoliorum]|uniref:3000802a-aa7e-4831-b9d0-99827151b752-CDS n=1 Tax=Sclerotinia trifoliorum TaxID=28548 RepID=A0A8H2W5A4_9HELO|nr:3000802a-aa7e-4831-b9d0-99827151b752-CDS [Sclerotinia trifoliorum]